MGSREDRQPHRSHQDGSWHDRSYGVKDDEVREELLLCYVDVFPADLGLGSVEQDLRIQLHAAYKNRDDVSMGPLRVNTPGEVDAPRSSHDGRPENGVVLVWTCARVKCAFIHEMIGSNKF